MSTVSYLRRTSYGCASIFVLLCPFDSCLLSPSKKLGRDWDNSHVSRKQVEEQTTDGKIGWDGCRSTKKKKKKYEISGEMLSISNFFTSFLHPFYILFTSFLHHHFLSYSVSFLSCSLFPHRLLFFLRLQSRLHLAL